MGAEIKRREQADFLRAHGFEPEPAGKGKGSHEMWVHPEFNALVRLQPELGIPPNLMTIRNLGHGFAKLTLSENLSAGRWTAVRKVAEYCSTTTAKAKEASAKAEKIATATRQFRENGKSAYDWRAMQQRYAAPQQQASF